jgi:hypothetical protein
MHLAAFQSVVTVQPAARPPFFADKGPLDILLYADGQVPLIRILEGQCDALSGHERRSEAGAHRERRECRRRADDEGSDDHRSMVAQSLLYFTVINKSEY